MQEKALLVIIELRSEKHCWPFEDVVQELRELTHTCGVTVVDTIECIRDKPTPNLFIGKGKAEELRALSQEYEVGAVIFSHDLSGTQQRNLEEVLEKKIVDRTQLILDIFALHAKTPEGKMQVELAQLQYLMPRLVGKGIILSRLGGGIGTRGPGEQKLEIDRRRIRQRIEKLKTDLEAVVLHRQVIRKKRKAKSLSQVVLIGYTNAGKSTLLNSLTDAGQPVHDGLFTTLDPLSKNLKLPNGEHVVLSDTVGFLNNLPHHLIEAFKATLEELKDAELLVHVLDASHSRVYDHYKAVQEVLRQLQAEDKPIITVLNKIDLIDDDVWLSRLKNDFKGAIGISAKYNRNIGLLLHEIQKNLIPSMEYHEIIIRYDTMELLDIFYKEGKILDSQYLQEGIKIKVNIPRIIFDKLLQGKKIEVIN
ncbi:MAG: GTPase HflX [Candidatus Omnitrophica bacterium]|nr:GTPase HflX [Candidatus Omnitrophota bacterium]